MGLRSQSGGWLILYVCFGLSLLHYTKTRPSRRIYMTEPLEAIYV